MALNFSSMLSFVSYGVFFASSVIFFMTYMVSGCFPVLAPLQGCERVPSDDILALLIMMLVHVIDLSVLDFFFDGGAASRSPSLKTLISCAELLSLLFRTFLFRGMSFSAISPRTP